MTDKTITAEKAAAEAIQRGSEQRTYDHDNHLANMGAGVGQGKAAAIVNEEPNIFELRNAVKAATNRNNAEVQRQAGNQSYAREQNLASPRDEELPAEEQLLSQGAAVAQGVSGTLVTMARELAGKALVQENTTQPPREELHAPQRIIQKDAPAAEPPKGLAGMDKSALAAAAGLGADLQRGGTQRVGDAARAQAGAAQNATVTKQQGHER